MKITWYPVIHDEVQGYQKGINNLIYSIIIIYDICM
jgi:hypothetical protein